MHWESWIFLGITVTLLVYMAQRLVSSISPTRYASAASCRHKMACSWKCRSYLPTSRAISWTSCKKGSFWMRSPVLFWNQQISQRATVPGWYFQVFFNGAAHKNSFWGALPPMVGQSFLWAGSSPPNLDGPVSAAIWTNCWVGNKCGDIPTSSSCSTSVILLMISSGSGGVSCAGDRGVHWWWGSLILHMHLCPGFDLHPHMHLGSHHHPHIFPILPLVGYYLHSHHTGI